MLYSALSGLERLVGDGAELVKGIHIGNGQIREDLAVDLNTGELKAVDELGVVGAADPGAGVNTGDPKAAILTLLELPADVSVGEGLHNLLARSAIELGLGAPITLGQILRL